jgi:hypothetical protein
MGLDPIGPGGGPENPGKRSLDASWTRSDRPDDRRDIRRFVGVQLRRRPATGVYSNESRKSRGGTKNSWPVTASE